MHERMRDGEVGLGDAEVVVEQDVDVDGAVVIDAVDRLSPAPQPALYLLGGLQELTRCERGLNTDAGVEETMRGLEAPWLGLKKGRLANNASDVFANQSYGTQQVLPAAPEVGAQGEVGLMLLSHSQ